MISYKRTGWRTDVIVGLSTETKPTDVENGYRFCEIDTGYMFAFDAEHSQWHKLPGSSVDEDEVRAIIDDATAELQAELDEAISGATVDSEVINARVDADGTTYGTLKQRLDAENTALKSALTLVQDFDWKVGYIHANGNIIQNDTTRRYSGLIVCPPNSAITYVAEKHSNVCGISFYDRNGTFQVGVQYTGTDAQNTVTSPTNARYLRLSTTVALMNDTFVSFDKKALVVINDSIATIEDKFDRYIPFVTSGGTRSAFYTDVGDIITASVIDSDYDITLYYGESRNTPWSKTINVSEYPNPTSLQLRKSDNSAMPANSAKQVAIAMRETTVVIYSDIEEKNDVCYVQTSGSDLNNGLTRFAPFATIQKAIDEGFKKIFVREGTYTSGFSMSGLSGVSIELDRNYDAFTAGTKENHPKIVIDGSNIVATGITIADCNDCTFVSIEVKNCTSKGWQISRSSNLTFSDCVAHDIAIGSTSGGGFVITYTSADFTNCGVYNCGTVSASTSAPYHIDGFNIHGTGTTNFIDCFGYNCLDDAISHHDACYGVIDGGEWYGCGKGGIASPTHGAKIDIRNAYCHDNGYGIYALSDGSVLTERMAINITNCICKSNRDRDIEIGSYYTANVWNCIYDTYAGFIPLT